MGNRSGNIKTEVYFVDCNGTEHKWCAIDSTGLIKHMLSEDEHKKRCTDVCRLLYKSYKKTM